MVMVDDDEVEDEPKIDDEDPFDDEDMDTHFQPPDKMKAQDRIDDEPRGQNKQKIDIFNDPLLPDEPKEVRKGGKKKDRAGSFDKKDSP